MRRTRALQHGGFSLMELLTVTAVLAVLAALLFPVFAAARERARQATCLAHLRQISQAHLLYLQDWDEQFVPWYVPAPPRPKPFGAYSFWTEFLRPYFKTVAVLRDPSAPREGQDPNWLADYALPTWGPGGQGTPEQPYFLWPGPPLSLVQVVRPAQTIQLSDGRTRTFGVQIDTLSRPRPGERPGYRHGRGCNLAFLDGHTRWMPAEEVKRVDFDERGVYQRYAAADR